MSEKINILVVPPDTYGVSYYRLINPYIEIQKQFPDEFNIEINSKPSYEDSDYLKKFDVIHGHRTFVDYSQMERFTKYLKELNIISILDIDDFWTTGRHHPMHDVAKSMGLDKKIPSALKLVDYVTTTTEFFKNIIKFYNPNTIVFPNAIDINSKNFAISKTKSKRLRFIYLAGSSHKFDLKVLEEPFKKVNKKYSDDVQWVLCGFDLRGTFTEVLKDGRTKDRPILPKETCWYDYEKYMTSNYDLIIDEPYKDFLFKYKQEVYDDSNQPYKRVWTKPLSTYATNYNLGDVSLAPLEKGDGLFNSVKSNLKVIEAGFHKMPIIASDIEPYQVDIVHGVNGFLVNNNSKNKGWDYYIEYFIKNPEKVKEMGEALYETVKDKYDIRNVSKDRANWLKEILKNKLEKQIN